MKTVSVLTCPDCGALGLDCEPSSEDEALYNCPECGFYRTYEIGSEDDWQEAEYELEQEWVPLQDVPDLIDYRSIDADVLRVAHAVKSLRTPREVESAFEENQLGENAGEKLRVQIRKRKQAMKGLDQEIRRLEQIIEEVENRGEKR